MLSQPLKPSSLKGCPNKARVHVSELEDGWPGKFSMIRTQPDPVHFPMRMRARRQCQKQQFPRCMEKDNSAPRLAMEETTSFRQQGSLLQNVFCRYGLYANVLCRSARRSQQVAMRHVLRVLLLNLKLAALQLEMRERASRATCVRKSSDFAGGAAGTYFAYYFCT